METGLNPAASLRDEPLCSISGVDASRRLRAAQPAVCATDSLEWIQKFVLKHLWCPHEGVCGSFDSSFHRKFQLCFQQQRVNVVCSVPFESAVSACAQHFVKRAVHRRLPPACSVQSITVGMCVCLCTWLIEPNQKQIWWKGNQCQNLQDQMMFWVTCHPPPGKLTNL